MLDDDHAELTARTLPDQPHCPCVKLDRGGRAVRQRGTAVGGARVDARLAQIGYAAQYQGENLQVRNKLPRGAVLAADFPDLAAHGDGHAFWLKAADELQKVRRPSSVVVLLLAERSPTEVHERARVYVDVEEPGRDCLADELFNRPDLLLRVLSKLRRAYLEVVTLYEHRAGPASRDCSGKDGRRVLLWRLTRVAHLGARQLEDDRGGINLKGLSEGCLGKIERHGAEVHSGYGELFRQIPTRHRPVEGMNGRGINAEFLGQLLD